MSNSTSTTPGLPTPTPTSSPPAAGTTDSVPTSDPTSDTSPTSDTTTPNPTTDIPPTTSSSTEIPTTSSSQFSTSSTEIPTTSSSSVESSTSTTAPPTSTTEPPTSTTPPTSSDITITTKNPNGSTVVVITTKTQSSIPIASTSTSSSATPTNSAGMIIGDKSSSSKGLGTGGTIAVAVVVPIVAVALIILAGLFFWRKRKQRKDAEELRRKEVEEYGYNPNNDPTLPAVGAGSDGPFEMREDESSGYRGWGTTAVASSGRKASTTLSGGQSGGVGMAYSEGTSPSHGHVSDTQSNNPLVDGHPISGAETEALGAMGPAASGNRSGDINRGPSNASSSYSAANRSDGSGEIPGAGGGYYNNQYDTGNPYADTQYGSPPQGRAEISGQPVIRDVQARRNTRIENPSHFAQQSAGISQNF